jgi:hypothetical protein
MTHVGKIFLSVTAIILTTLCKLTPAPAQVFSALQDQGGILASDPSCTSASNGAICAVVGYGGGLFIDTYNSGNWSGLQNRNGIVIGKPSCTRFRNSVQALCGTIGTAGDVWVAVFDGTSNWNWRSIPGTSISNPACAGFGIGATGAICAVIGPNSHLFASATSDGVSWSPFQEFNLGGTLIFNPTCTDIAFASVLCGAVTTAGELRTVQFNVQTSTNPVTITPIFPVTITFAPNSNMSITSDPSCAGVNMDYIICGVRGSDSALWFSEFQRGVATFPLFNFAGGVLAGAPSCASKNTSQTANPGMPLMRFCAVRGTDSTLYVTEFQKAGLCVLGRQCGYLWQAIPPDAIDIKGDPSCTPMLVPVSGLSQPQVLCGVKSTSSQLWVTIGK